MNPLLTLPKVNKESSLQEQVNQMQSQIFQLKEQIEWLLSVMDTETKKEIETAKTGLEDFVQSSVVQNGDYKSVINQTAAKINTRIDGVEGNVSTLTQTSTKIETAVFDASGNSRIQQNASNINLKVGYNDVISAINLSPEAVDINADRINLNGATTINGRFYIDTNGYLHLSTNNASMELVDNGGSYRNLTGLVVTSGSNQMCYGSQSILDEEGKPIITTIGSGYYQFGNFLGETWINSKSRPEVHVNHKKEEMAFLSDITGGGGGGYPYGLEEQRSSTYGTYYAIDKTQSGNANNIPTVEWVINYLATH